VRGEGTRAKCSVHIGRETKKARLSELSSGGLFTE
jgi:hypothetical protein